MKKAWAVKDAKARFSEFLDTCLKEGPQVVTKHGTEMAVLVSAEEWHRLTQAVRPSLKQLLLSDKARMNLPPPNVG
jgi:prevent-host-death family protein